MSAAVVSEVPPAPMSYQAPVSYAAAPQPYALQPSLVYSSPAGAQPVAYYADAQQPVTYLPSLEDQPLVYDAAPLEAQQPLVYVEAPETHPMVYYTTDAQPRDAQQVVCCASPEDASPPLMYASPLEAGPLVYSQPPREVFDVSPEQFAMLAAGGSLTQPEVDAMLRAAPSSVGLGLAEPRPSASVPAAPAVGSKKKTSSTKALKGSKKNQQGLLLSSGFGVSSVLGAST